MSFHTRHFTASRGVRKQWAGHTPVPALTTSYLGSATGAMLTRIRPVFPFPVRRIRIVVPLFSVNLYSAPVLMRDAIFGSPGDTLGGGAVSRDKLAFAFGIGAVTNGYTGIPARQPVTFDGVNYYQHDYTAHAAQLAIDPSATSDIYDFGTEIPANTAGFDLWSVVESESAYFTTGGVLPLTFVGSNYAVNRYEFLYRHSTLAAAPLSGIKAKGGSFDLALDPFPTADVPNLFVPTGFPATQTGGGNGFAPMFEVEVNGTWQTYAGWGDSHTAGVGEGTAGSTDASSVIYGDVRGGQYGNAGWPQRLVAEELKRPFINLGRASDGAKYDNRNPDYTACRRALLKRFKPAYIFFLYATNDIGGTTTYTPADSPTANKWTGNTAFRAGQALYNGANCYQCTKDGTSAASGGPTGTGTSIADGTTMWKYLWPMANGGIGLAVQLGYQAFVRADLPDARTYQATALPLDASTDSFATVAGQTPSSNYGDATTVRGGFNYGVRRNLLNVTAIIDLGRYGGVENTCVVNADNTATEDSKWVVNGQASYLTGDGGHLNSHGAQLTAHNLSAAYAYLWAR